MEPQEIGVSKLLLKEELHNIIPPLGRNEGGHEPEGGHENELFHFKQFAVEHGSSTMRVGTDAVLLGAWCRVQGVQRVLDVGTGCGVIALMVAQRCPAAVVDAIDIDAASVVEAQRNFATSPSAGRLRATYADFNEWVGENYDLIVSNPPFFINGIQSPDAARASARHTITLDYARLIAHARHLLAPSGRLAMVAPADARSQVIEQAAFQSMDIARLCEVTSVVGKQPKRLLWELTPSRASLTRESIAIKEANGHYTEAYRALCRDFYIEL